MRKQTQKATFGVEDISLQDNDQFKISNEDIEGLRGNYNEKIEAKKKEQDNIHKKQLEKAKRKAGKKKVKN